MNWLIAGIYFLLSVANEDLSVRWQWARTRGHYIKGANLSVLIGAIGWLPLLLFVVSDNWQIICADLLGSWVGSYWGIRRAVSETR